MIVLEIQSLFQMWRPLTNWIAKKVRTTPGALVTMLVEIEIKMASATTVH